MIGDFASDRFILLTWPVGEAALTWYVRPGGDDNNDGTTALTAFATIARALREVPLYAANRPTVINVTGMTIAIAELLQLGGGSLGSTINTYSTPVVPDLPNRRQVQIVADLTAVQALTVTSQVADPATNLTTLTVSDAITPGALDDLILIDVDGGIGPIVKNGYTSGAGPNTIYVSSATTFAAATTAYAVGATLTYGDPAQGLDGAIYLTALADWSFRGIGFASTAASKAAALTIWAHQPVDLYACVLDGLHLAGGAAQVFTYGSIIRDGSLVIEGGANLLAQKTTGHDLTISTTKGRATLSEVVLDTCSPFGGGSSSSQFSGEVTQAEVRNGTGAGIQCRFGTWTLSNLRCTDNLGSGVYVLGAFEVSMTTVVGTGNDYGLECLRNASVTTDSSTDVTGASGDVYLGNAGTFAWTDFSPTLPITDTEQLVRVFHQGGV